jgi:hypothetical protein
MIVADILYVLSRKAQLTLLTLGMMLRAVATMNFMLR